MVSETPKVLRWPLFGVGADVRAGSEADVRLECAELECCARARGRSLLRSVV
jgi:hypothetical protein